MAEAPVKKVPVHPQVLANVYAAENEWRRERMLHLEITVHRQREEIAALTAKLAALTADQEPDTDGD